MSWDQNRLQTCTCQNYTRLVLRVRHHRSCGTQAAKKNQKKKKTTKKQARTCVPKQNTRLQHGSVGYTVEVLESLCVCVVSECVCPVRGIGPRQSALPAFCPLVFSLLMDGPCSAPSGYRIFHINHHKHAHTHAHIHTAFS